MPPSLGVTPPKPQNKLPQTNKLFKDIRPERRRHRGLSFLLMFLIFGSYRSASKSLHHCQIPPLHPPLVCRLALASLKLYLPKQRSNIRSGPAGQALFHLPGMENLCSVCVCVCVSACASLPTLICRPEITENAAELRRLLTRQTFASTL